MNLMKNCLSFCPCLRFTILNNKCYCNASSFDRNMILIGFMSVTLDDNIKFAREVYPTILEQEKKIMEAHKKFKNAHEFNTALGKLKYRLRRNKFPEDEYQEHIASCKCDHLEHKTY